MILFLWAIRLYRLFFNMPQGIKALMSGQITQNNQYKKIITNLILTCYNKFVIVKGEVLYRIEFYEDERGISSIKDFITELNAKAKTDKTSLKVR